MSKRHDDTSEIAHVERAEMVYALSCAWHFNRWDDPRIPRPCLEQVKRAMLEQRDRDRRIEEGSRGKADGQT
jgi:hypothetical protein